MTRCRHQAGRGSPRMRRYDARMADDKPRGVRIRDPAGNATECEIARDPESDRDGAPAWLARVPPGFDWEEGSHLEADHFPDGTILVIPAMRLTLANKVPRPDRR